jgi:hypothetical protein
VKRVIHFVRLESPSEAFRCTCGEWRAGASWTTARKLVTCNECLNRMVERERQAPETDNLGASH